MEILIDVFLWLWSHCPILCLSDDNNFATLEWAKIRERKVHYRISLFNIMLGDRIIYILTFDIIKREISFGSVLCLEKLEGILLTDDKINEIQGRFREHLETLEEEELEIEKEKLCYHIQHEEQRINTSVEKINIYATIILTVLPLLLAILDLKALVQLPIVLFLGTVLIAYALLNICIFVFRVIKVHRIKKSTFGDLRHSVKKDKEIVVQYQYDWQQLKYKAQLFVSFVLNLQNWAIFLLVLLVAIWLGVTYQNDDKQMDDNYKAESTISTLDLDEFNLSYSDSAVEWQEIILAIEKKECNHIIIILNGDVPLEVQNLDKYDGLKVEILFDEKMDADIMKIIREI